VAVVACVGLLFSWLRWHPEQPIATPINLALCFGGAVVLIATRATVDVGDPPGGLHAMAEVFALVIAVRAFALTDATRIRSALLLSLGALLGGAAYADMTEVLPWLFVWLVAAIACLVALAEVAAAELPSLAGHVSSRPRWDRRAREAGAVLALVVLAALVVVVIDPDPGRGQPRLGSQPGDQQIAPYVGHEQSLDTSRRGQLSDDVVMKVRASAPDFWRGQSFDRWDGQAWHRSALTNSSFAVEGDGFVPAGIGDQPGGGQTLVQRVRVEAPYMQAIFGAYRVDEINTALGGMTVHGDGSIELREPIGRGSEYTVISLRSPVTPALLRDNDPGAAADLPSTISDLYLQLPASVPQRVTALAHQLTDGKPTAYDKVLAIESWLGANTKYTLKIPPLPDGADAVEQHLFVDRAGFCEQIATSTAVLLRSVGVAARVATGFVPGDESLLGGEFTVRAKDAHAWVEVWFPNVGWQAFDPTANVPLAGESSKAVGERALDLLRRIAPMLALLATLLVIGVITALAWRRIEARRAAARAPWSARYLAKLEAAGTARGRPRTPPETPAEYAAALARSVLPDDRLVAAGAVLTQATYGKDEPPPSARTEAELVLGEAESAHPVRSRRTSRP
jgi:transglutaminase-like putative cysteine protease